MIGKTKEELNEIWDEKHKIPGWLGELGRSGKYSEEDITKLEEIDDETLKLPDNINAKWKYPRERSQIMREITYFDSLDAKRDILKPIPLKDLMQKEFSETEWLVEQLIPSEGIIALSGAPATYKTWLILDVATKVAKGDILFDKFVTTKTGVMVIDEENGERLLQKRLQKVNKNPDLPVYFLSYKDFKLSESNAEYLISFAKESSVKLVIFDSLVRIHSSDENDAMKMAGVFSLLKKFSKEGITVVFTHHNRKQGFARSNPAQDMRGSSDILASVDCHLAVDRKPKDDFLTITQTKLRQGEEIKPFKLNVINDDSDLKFEFAGEIDEIQTKKADIKEAVKDILEQGGEPMFGKELHDALRNTGVEGGYSTFKSAINELVEKLELFSKPGGKGNKTFYSLTPFEQENIINE